MSAPIEILAQEASSTPRTWSIHVSEAGLRFQSEGVDETIAADRIASDAFLTVGGIFPPAVVADLDGTRRVLQLEHEAAHELLAGLGPTLATRWMLARQMKWFAPIALLFVVSSLPILGLDLDLTGLVLGVGLLAMAGLARLRPRPWLLVADALWLLALVIDGVLAVVWGEDHPAWLVLSFFLTTMVVSAFKQYRMLRASTRRRA